MAVGTGLRSNRAERLSAPLPFELLESRMLLSAVATAALNNLYATATWRLANQAFGAKPAGSATAPGSAVTPSQMRSAYGVNSVSLPNVATANGAGQTIAIIDAGDNPNAFADLQKFDATYGLQDPAFEKINQTGGGTAPSTGPGWQLEEALDVEWAHVMAPAANIVLVESNSATFNDLFTAVQTAKGTTFNGSPVSVVSMSWGGGEFGGESAYDGIFTSNAGHPVSFFASSGDGGAAVSYPAASPNVVAVGGTHLLVSSSGVYQGESAWSASSGSLSTQESQPSYQSGIVTQSTTRRGTPDISLDADPATGVPVYDSFDGAGTSGSWFQVGGTSLSSPMMAAVVALANQGRVANGLANLDGATGTLPRIYALPQTDFNDITSGGNSLSSTSAGYDLVTGRGTPIASSFVPDLAGLGVAKTPSAPTIGSLTASPNSATTAQAISLTANSVVDSSGTVTSVSFYRESNGTSGLQTGAGGDTLIATDTSSSGGWTATQAAGLAAGSYTFYAQAADSNGLTSNIASAGETVTTTAPVTQLTPVSFQSDIGSVKTAGTATVSGSAYALTGSGADIWGTSDAFHYAYTSISGNGTYIARVAGVSNTNGWAKAGIMLRESLAANSRQASIFITPGNGASMQWRSATGGASSSTTVTTAGSTKIAAPYWVRLVRNGNAITTSYSLNGSSWTTLGTQTVAIASNAYIGLAVTAHNNNAVCSAQFDNVSFTASVATSVSPALASASNSNSTTAAFARSFADHGLWPSTFTLGNTAPNGSNNSGADASDSFSYTMNLDCLTGSNSSQS